VLSEGIGVTSSASLKTNSLDIMNKHKNKNKNSMSKIYTVNRRKGLLLKTKDLHTNTNRTKAEKNYRPYQQLILK
jgi:hypothetical protein